MTNINPLSSDYKRCSTLPADINPIVTDIEPFPIKPLPLPSTEPLENLLAAVGKSRVQFAGFLESTISEISHKDFSDEFNKERCIYLLMLLRVDISSATSFFGGGIGGQQLENLNACLDKIIEQHRYEEVRNKAREIKEFLIKKNQ